MAFEHWGYTFEGAWNHPNNLEPRPGIYVIWCKTETVWSVLDAGESQDVKAAVLAHPRKDDWKIKCTGEMYYAATYTPSLEPSGRKEIEQKIRLIGRPACG
jgi:hypothetical protein